MHIDELPGNCGIAVLRDFSPMNTIESIKSQCKEAKDSRYRYIIATLNDEQVKNLEPKLRKAGFKRVRKGINPMHYSTIYIYIKDLGVYKNDNKYNWELD